MIEFKSDKPHEDIYNKNILMKSVAEFLDVFNKVQGCKSISLDNDPEKKETLLLCGEIMAKTLLGQKPLDIKRERAYLEMSRVKSLDEQKVR